ncbi:methyltransferase domain-containing protein [bacterium]|nr:methyltransferase domain-containing protein [bacterium]
MTSPPPPPPSRPPVDGLDDRALIFDRRRHARRRERTRREFPAHAFLKDLAAEDIVERLAAVNRSFPRVLDLGAHDGRLGRRLASDPLLAPRIGEVFSCDLAPGWPKAPLGVAADEEALPFRDGSLDLVVSAMSLHWVNDLPGALIQVRRALKPDGLFIGVLPGGRTLQELRRALLLAEAQVRGGAGMRVSPFLDVIDAAQLLQRAGFAMPVSDSETRTVRYPDVFALFSELRGLGETAAFRTAAPPLSRRILTRAAEIYSDAFSDPDGRIRATVELVAMSGWAPAPTQPKPLRPGSAKTRLADALGVKEQAAGDAAIPRRLARPSPDQSGGEDPSGEG